jgi:hypothetical protein
VAEFFEFVAQLTVVVNLAVENDPGSAILIVNRLLPALQVDDRQAAHAKADRLIEIETIIVRSTMTDGGAHAAEQCLIDF